MENNYSYSSLPESTTSTPRSRETDSETASCDEQVTNNPNPNYKVKFMCSYGGKILPRPHDNQLAYVGGDTKILTVDRNVTYASISQKLNSLSDSSGVCFKYQLPGEDLDALISVTNDEDLDHMMTEYDRLRASVKPARLRLFLFPLSAENFGGGGGGESNSERQWFVDALNSVQISSAESSSPAEASSPASVENPDFLFGFDKENASVPMPTKVQDVAAAVVVPQANVSDAVRAGSESGSEDNNNNRQVMGDQAYSPVMETPRQIQESQRLQIATNHEQLINSNPPKAYYGGDYYSQTIPTQAGMGQPQYWQDQRHMTTGGYSMSVAGSDSPVYLITTSTGAYPAPAPAPAQSVRPVMGQVTQGHAYHGMQRLANPPEFYQRQVYNAVPQPSIQQPKIATYPEAPGMVRTPADLGYRHVGVDAAGRQVCYTMPQGGVLIPSYQPALAADMRHGGGLAVSPDGKMIGNPNKGPPL